MPHNLVSIIIPALEEPYLDELKGHIGEVMREIKTPHEVLVQQERGLSNAVLSGARGGDHSRHGRRRIPSPRGCASDD